jgi:hypothetical protein
MRRAVLLSSGLLCAATLPASAQIRASERGWVGQTIDGTKISIDYARPRARGREPIFGKVVHWGEVWTPGANDATTLEVNSPIRLDGHAVPKGKYSVWLVVREQGPWTMVLDPDFRRFHMNPPDSNATQVRFPVQTVQAPFEEALTWTISDLEVSSATLGMHWGPTRVAMKLEVTPTLRMETPAAEAAAYLGRYDWVWKGPDSTKKVQLVVTWENGWMMGDFEPKDDYFDHFALIRVKDGWYTLGLFEKGRIYEVVSEWVISFDRNAMGKLTFELRQDTDELLATGSKRP